MGSRIVELALLVTGLAVGVAVFAAELHHLLQGLAP